MTNPRIEYVFETELKVYLSIRCRQGTRVRKLSVDLLLVSMYGSEFNIECVKRSLVLDKNCSTCSKDEKLKILQTNKMSWKRVNFHILYSQFEQCSKV